MKITAAVLCAASLFVVGLSAQSIEHTTKKKITVEHGKDVTVVGCIERSTGETPFVLTKVADKRGSLKNYTLVSEDIDDLAKHVGHLVRIEGKAADRGDAKVKIETHSETSGHDDRETHGKTTLKGDLPNVDYLGVKSVKFIAAACPQ